ncbi:TIGR02391 family protein [Patescibacteria group bacterium]|nr:TIGR02391 family protein [Patescibacteria group bacterium]
MDFLHLEIEKNKKIKIKISNQDYDGAILDSLMLLESKLQELLGQRTYGTSLIDDVFDNNHLIVSHNSNKQLGAKQLFSGAIRLIRNDRGHNDSTEIAIELPCKNKKDCAKYLGFISLLFDYHDKNLATMPVLESFRVNGNCLEILGENFSKNKDIQVCVNEKKVKIVNVSDSVMAISVPSKKEGIILFERNGQISNSISYVIHTPEYNNCYLIEGTNIPIFKDNKGKEKIRGVTAIKIGVFENGKEYTRMAPTKRVYSIGDYVSHSYTNESISFQAWYKDSTDKRYKSAWISSCLYNGEKLAKKGEFTIKSLEIRPGRIILGANEKRLIRAIVIKSDKFRDIEEDITEKVEWQIADEKIAFINNKKKGLLTAHRLGKTLITCKLGTLYAKAEVDVITPVIGTKVKFFSNHLRTYEQIAVDSDNNLYISNQNRHIYKVSTKEGSVEKIISLPNYEDPVEGFITHPPFIDCISVSKQDVLYINSFVPRAIYSFKNQKLHKLIEGGDGSALKDIAIDSRETVYAATMTNHVAIIPEGKEPSFLELPIEAAFLRLLNDSQLVVLDKANVFIFKTKNGDLIRQFHVPAIGSISDFAVKGNSLYVASFHGEKIYKIDINTEKCSILAQTNGTLGGLSFDMDGNLLFSIFSAEKIEDVCIYKIYLK